MRWFVLAFVVAAGCNDGATPRLPPDDLPDCCVTPDPCATCGPSEICVASYDGQCRQNIACVPRVVDCPANACSPACEAAYCAAPYQCQTREPCGGESPNAFTCYGP
jgi:hypothetical protein